MKYKVGDKVRVKSYARLEAEYPKNNLGNILCGTDVFVADMMELCGKTLTISSVFEDVRKYTVAGENYWTFTDEMFEDVENDVVNHPAHYTQGEIECIDAMKAAFGADELAVYCKIAAFKYVWRCEHKNGLEDVKKAVWYLNKYIDLKGGNTDVDTVSAGAETS